MLSPSCAVHWSSTSCEIGLSPSNFFIVDLGSGRVTFCTHASYMKAVRAAFVEIRTPKFSKKVQIDPYLEDSAPCSMCQIQQGPYFCRELPVSRPIVKVLKLAYDW